MSGPGLEVSVPLDFPEAARDALRTAETDAQVLRTYSARALTSCHLASWGPQLPGAGVPGRRRRDPQPADLSP